MQKGVLVKHGHDQHRVLREADLANNIPALQTGFKVNGTWEAKKVAFFNNRIITADASSYANQDWTTTSSNHAMQKHAKYERAVDDIRGSFTPLICSTKGVLHKEYATFQIRTDETMAINGGSLNLKSLYG